MRVCDSTSGKKSLKVPGAPSIESARQRTCARRKTCLNGRILFNLGRSSMSVRVRNLSEDGARLSLSIPWPCPRLFNLEIYRTAPALPVTRRCQVVWQHGMTLGIRFIEQDQSAAILSVPR